MDNNKMIVIMYRYCSLALAKLDNSRSSRFYEKDSVVSLV